MVPEDVKRGSTSGGQARTRLARRAVIDAARTLFVDHGYAATTIAAISRAADVPEPTVYRLFSSKLGILKALLDVSIAGDDQPIAVHSRPNVAALFDEPDPHKVLAGFAAITAAINQRTNDVYNVLSRAADVDPEAAELLGTLRQQRDQGQGHIVRALHRKRALRAGLRIQEAADIVHAIMAPEVYRLLVHERSWTPDRYQQWATRTLIQQLT
jgi:AcrR family transcriptional regulator